MGATHECRRPFTDSTTAAPDARPSLLVGNSDVFALLVAPLISLSRSVAGRVRECNADLWSGHPRRAGDVLSLPADHGTTSGARTARGGFIAIIGPAFPESTFATAPGTPQNHSARWPSACSRSSWSTRRTGRVRRLRHEPVSSSFPRVASFESTRWAAHPGSPT